MPNTLNAALVGTVLADAALVQFSHNLASFIHFWRDLTPDPIAPRRPIQVGVQTAGSTTLTNEVANFEQGNSTLGVVTIGPDHFSQPFHIDVAQYNQGFRLEQLAEINAKVLSQTLWAKVTALMVNNASPALGYPVANSVVATLATFTPATLGTVYGLLKGTGPKHMLISPEGMGKLLYTTPAGIFPIAGNAGGIKAMGFESIEEQSQWNGAQANSYGFGFFPEAIVLASGVPATPAVAGALLDQRLITDPLTGLTVQFNMWYSNVSRSVWGSYDIIFGCARGVPTAGVTLVTA